MYIHQARKILADRQAQLENDMNAARKRNPNLTDTEILVADLHLAGRVHELSQIAMAWIVADDTL